MELSVKNYLLITSQFTKATQFVNHLQEFAPLNDMSPSHLRAVLERASIHRCKAGEVLSPNDLSQLYLIQGEIHLIGADELVEMTHGENERVPFLSPNDKSFTARAATDILYVEIPYELLDSLLTWSQVADYLHQQISLERDLDDDIDWMMAMLHSNLFFKVPPINIKKIFGALTPCWVHAEEVIVRQGELGDCCYFIKEGTAQVLRQDDGQVNVLAEIGHARCFGEDALVNIAPRNATVKMLTDGILMRLDAKDFALLLMENESEMMSIEELATSMDTLEVIDVRSEAEYGAWHLPRAVNLPLNLLAMKSRLLSKDQPYVCYCTTGRRSGAAASLLREQGFNVVSLRDCERLMYEEFSQLRETFPKYLLRHGVAVPEA